MTPTSRDSQKEAALGQDSLHEPLDSLSIELSRISAEIQSINSGFQAGMQQAIIDARAALEREYAARFEKSMDQVKEQLRIEVRDELKKAFEFELQERVERINEVRSEIERVAAQLEGVTREIGAMLDDPSIDLSRVMQKRKEQAELKAYLDGLRFSIGDDQKIKSAGA